VRTYQLNHQPTTSSYRTAVDYHFIANDFTQQHKNSDSIWTKWCKNDIIWMGHLWKPARFYKEDA